MVGLFKLAIEIGQIGETDFRCNLKDREAGMLEKLGRLA